jgi:predicted transposase YdaD
MTGTDSPLKEFVTMFITEIAAWLLQAEVRQVEARPEELRLPNDPVYSDLIFFVTLANGRTALLHIEFQGRRSHRPMRLRLLDYMTRLILRYPDLEMLHVVIYVGKGAGRDDTGVHQVYRPDGAVSIQWNYQVVRLWEMEAEEVLAWNQPALLPLVGQMRIPDPTTLVPEVIRRIQAVAEEASRRRLFLALVSLTENEEVLAMIEQFIEEEGVLLDTPFLRKLRREGWEEGHQEGREEGREEGHREGREEERSRMVHRTVLLRFGAVPPDLEAHLRGLSLDELDALFVAALTVPSLEAFRAHLPAQHGNGVG